MPVDYSKWDALELSDDSDVEVHPNVDKRSFIRAKQNQIHHERQQRKKHIESLKYDRQINEALAKRISSLLDALKAHAAEAGQRNPAELAFQAVMESAGRQEDDQPPPRPADIQAKSDQDPMPTYTKMMATLLDQVNQALDEKKPGDRYSAMVDELQVHQDKVQGLQNELLTKLAELEKAEGSKITSESYKTGFDSSFVNRSASSTAEGQKGGSSKVELLNPGYDASKTENSSASPTDAPTTGGKIENLEEGECSPDGLRFAKIKPAEYRESHQFLMTHPHVLSEKEQDGIMVMGFDAQLQGNDTLSRNYIHQALLIQYCRSLGRDGVPLFFKRITTPGHQAQDVFFKDVQDTHLRIKNRCREINAERSESGETEEVEQIQLHAVEPGTVINITIPPEQSEDEATKQARAIFDGFPAEMKEALKSANLDIVNKVLGKMKVAEAEELVGQLSEAGILGVEQEIIDATTEAGQNQLREMETKAEDEDGN